MENFFNKKYSIKLIWLITIVFIIIAAGTFIFLYYIQECNSKDSFDYTSKFTLTLLALLTLLYHLHNLENQIRTQQKSNQQNLAKYTYDICSDFRKPMMMDINEDLRYLIKLQEQNLEKGKIDSFISFIENPDNKKYRQSLIVTLNYFESISAMVLAGDLDNEIVKRLFGKLFGRYYNKLKHYIDFRQDESNRSWINFEKLVKKWFKDSEE
ncbi:DUF4760 domain-containing protein [Flavobacterium sp.]|uniref:DUF4760 domain-containing protein n=1 Tax=Flavobacterium sp. TaxID=239 RepID=UPI0022BE1598|nr:DUF4760 domain-containing protein [Flavobacterium sp.]MCZ8229631.1 DUF4760 domain-containing protein [Flavobacterium sp.]